MGVPGWQKRRSTQSTLSGYVGAAIYIVRPSPCVAAMALSALSTRSSYSERTGWYGQNPGKPLRTRGRSPVHAALAPYYKNYKSPMKRHQVSAVTIHSIHEPIPTRTDDLIWFSTE